MFTIYFLDVRTFKIYHLFIISHSFKLFSSSSINTLSDLKYFESPKNRAHIRQLFSNNSSSYSCSHFYVLKQDGSSELFCCGKIYLDVLCLQALTKCNLMSIVVIFIKIHTMKFVTFMENVLNFCDRNVNIHQVISFFYVKS